MSIHIHEGSSTVNNGTKQALWTPAVSQLRKMDIDDMVNGLEFLERFPCTHSYTDGRGCHARCLPAHQEQFGVQYLAQGHFEMQPGEQGIPTFRLLDSPLGTGFKSDLWHFGAWHPPHSIPISSYISSCPIKQSQEKGQKNTFKEQRS